MTRYHYLIALLLGVIGILIIAIFVSLRSQADDTSATSNITNSAPTISDFYLLFANTRAGTSRGSFTGIDASVVGGQKTIVLLETDPSSTPVHGTTTLEFGVEFADDNGCREITAVSSTEPSVTVRAYRNKNNGTSSCYTPAHHSSAQNDCYVETNSSTYSEQRPGVAYSNIASMYRGSFTGCDSADDTTASATVYVDIFDFSTPTDDDGTGQGGKWTFVVNVSDGMATSATSTLHAEMGTLTSLKVSSTLALGGVAKDADTSEIEIGVENTGNSATMKLRWTSVDGVRGSSGDTYYDFDCDAGWLAMSNLKAASSSGVAYASKFAMTTTSQPIDFYGNAAGPDNRYLNPPQTTTTESQRSTYWTLRATFPTGTAVKGSCTSTLRVTAY